MRRWRLLEAAPFRPRRQCCQLKNFVGAELAEGTAFRCVVNSGIHWMLGTSLVMTIRSTEIMTFEACPGGFGRKSTDVLLVLPPEDGLTVSAKPSQLLESVGTAIGSHLSSPIFTFFRILSKVGRTKQNIPISPISRLPTHLPSFPVFSGDCFSHGRKPQSTQSSLERCCCFFPLPERWQEKRPKQRKFVCFIEESHGTLSLHSWVS